MYDADLGVPCRYKDIIERAMRETVRSSSSETATKSLGIPNSRLLVPAMVPSAWGESQSLGRSTRRPYMWQPSAHR